MIAIDGQSGWVPRSLAASLLSLLQNSLENRQLCCSQSASVHAVTSSVQLHLQCEHLALAVGCNVHASQPDCGGDAFCYCSYEAKASLVHFSLSLRMLCRSRCHAQPLHPTGVDATHRRCAGHKPNIICAAFSLQPNARSLHSACDGTCSVTHKCRVIILTCYT